MYPKIVLQSGTEYDVADLSFSDSSTNPSTGSTVEFTAPAGAASPILRDPTPELHTSTHVYRIVTTNGSPDIGQPTRMTAKINGCQRRGPSVSELEQRILANLRKADDQTISTTDTGWLEILDVDDYGAVHQALTNLHSTGQIQWYREGHGDPNRATLSD
jgi:hypothetical protein